MEQQPDDQSRAMLSDILSIDTQLDDEGLRRMASDCLLKLRRQRLENELDKLQASLPTLPEEERAKETQRAFLLTKQLMDLQ